MDRALAPARRLHVVAGILLNSERHILIADRRQASSMQDFWEFPGGKVNAGESADLALRRELAEELGIEITTFEHYAHLTHDYADRSVAIDFFTVSDWRGTPSGVEGQRIRWVESSALDSAMMLPADAPIVATLRAVPVSKY